jgi:signal transduction histidine kinase
MNINRTFWRKTFLFFVFPFFGVSQVSLVDSLIRLSKTDIHDTVKTKLYGDISWELMANDINMSLSYAQKELALAMKTKRNEDIAQAESDIGNIYNRKSNYDTALIHYNNALKLRMDLKQEKKVAGIYTNIATVYMRQSKFKEALNINFKTLKVFEQIADTAKQAIVLGNIGNLYVELDQNKLAENFFYQGLRLARLAKSKLLEGNMLVQIGGIQFDKGIINNKVVSKVHLDSAFYFFSEAEKILMNLNVSYNLAVVYNNLGRIYVQYSDYDKAISYYNKALDLRIALNDVYGTGMSYLNLGRVYALKANYDLSKNYFMKCIPIFMEAKNYINLKQAYGELSEVFEAKKDYLGAMKYHQLYSQYADSVYTNENAQHLAEMQTKYETEKKDLELSKSKTELLLKDEEAKQKNTIIFSVIALAMLVFISGYFFYRKKQIQQKAEMDAELASQKELRAKSVIEAEEKERIRIATDLHDGVGQLLSAAKLNLSSLESKLNLHNTDEQTAFKNAIDLVDDSVKEVRAVSHNMMPNTLLKLGLASAVKEFITKIQGTPNLKVNLEIVGLTGRLEQEKETILYRVIQEVVSNIIKHAKASELTLQLIKHEKEISILIEDNGVGFDTSKMNDFDGIGLKNILSRVEFINGTVHFDSVVNRGTTVIIDVVTG